MIEVITVGGRSMKLVTSDWVAKENGLLVIITRGGKKVLFASGQWESLREYSE